MKNPFVLQPSLKMFNFLYTCVCVSVIVSVHVSAGSLPKGVIVLGELGGALGFSSKKSDIFIFLLKLCSAWSTAAPERTTQKLPKHHDTQAQCVQRKENHPENGKRKAECQREFNRGWHVHLTGLLITKCTFQTVCILTVEFWHDLMKLTDSALLLWRANQRHVQQ